jgi:two-component system, OmpR family, heavy metal sensor histidine kinase CusS
MSWKNDPDAVPPRAHRAPGARPWSLAARLTAWYASSAFALVLVATGFLYWALVTNLDHEDDEMMAGQISVLRGLLRDGPKDIAALQQKIEWQYAATQYERLYIRILDQTGRVIAETPDMSGALPTQVFPPPVPAGLDPGHGRNVRTSGDRTFRLLSALAARGSGEREGFVIQAGLDHTLEANLLAVYRRSMWVVLGVALALCGVVGHQIAWRGVRAVGDIAKTARRIRSTTLHERIEATGLPAELLALAGTFNEMLDRLQEAFDRLSQFSADIAHELRTPLSNLRGEAEVALGRARSPAEYREVLGSCLEECERLSRLVDALLFLARAERALASIERERVEVGQELRRAREFYGAAAAEGGVALDVSVDEPIGADLDRTLFQRALGNLVTNALAHTPTGGRVTLHATRDNGAVRVDVSDTGCGIPPEHLPHLFDRFYRVDRARSSASGGMGLGLAIVKSIATLHGGSVRIASDMGHGTRVTLSFPATG